MKRKINKGTIILCIFALLSLLSIIYMILVFSKYGFHSDCMGYLLQAKEQVKQHKFFPDGFHYTTVIFGYTTSVYMIPFVNLIQNDFLLHEIGSIIALIVVICLIWGLFWKDKKFAALSTIMLCYPLGYIYKDMMFYQSAYINILTVTLLNLILVKQLIKQENTKKRYVLLVLYLIVCIFTNYFGVGNYVYVEAPLIISILLKCWIDNGLDIKGVIRNEKKYIVVLVVTLVGMLIGLVIFKLLCIKLGFDTEIASGGIVYPSNIQRQWDYILENMFLMFGIVGTSSLFSLQSIVQCLLLVYMVVSIIVAPIYLIKHFDKITDEFDRVLVLYGVTENFLLLFLMIFCSMLEARYFIPVMLTNIFLVIYFVRFIVKEHTNMIGKVPVYMLVIVCILDNLVLYTDDETKKIIADTGIEQIIHPSVQSNLIDYLEELGLNYGYASFWHSYSNMIKSNSTVTIVPYDQNNPLLPYYFNGNKVDNLNYYACSEDLYNPELHQGRCFILLADGETIIDRYYELADETLWCDGYTILVYNQNLNNYEQLVETLYN